ncbi:unnamed protein product [Euphydryas editha]|uniref:Uncharacterized protein n=1 Tax=Euphydryas editha TaxID=104508 RepID=A0AAU9TQA4_EUPED|nr:unnamed protein product [Euphydryas editha]
MATAVQALLPLTKARATAGGDRSSPMTAARSRRCSAQAGHDTLVSRVCCAESSQQSLWWQSGVVSLLATTCKYLPKQPCPDNTCTSRKVRTPPPLLQYRLKRPDGPKTNLRRLQPSLPPCEGGAAGVIPP